MARLAKSGAAAAAPRVLHRTGSYRRPVSRAQIWHWIRHGKVTREHVLEVLDEETAAIRARVGESLAGRTPRDHTRRLR